MVSMVVNPTTWTFIELNLVPRDDFSGPEDDECNN